MKKLILLLIFVILTPVALLTWPATGLAAGECDLYTNHSAQGIFENFQSHEYVDGFLNVHFKTTANPAGAMTNAVRMLRSSDCLKVNNFTPAFFPLGLPAGIRNFSIRFYNLSGPSTYSYRVYDDDTNMLLNCSGCHVTFSVPVFTNFGPPHKAVFTLKINDVQGSSFVSTALDIQGQNSKTPVLIVPGVLGTDLVKGGDTLWVNPTAMVNDLGDEFMDPLQFKANLAPLDTSILVSEVIKKKSYLFFNFDYTQGLLTEFTNQGYIEGQDLFMFPYDWRYGINQTNLDALKNKINEIRNGGEVDIVAHSTGGLLVKEYVMNNPGNHYINKAVFVGVPNTGAPKAVKVFVQGDGFGIVALADGEMKKIAQNLPVVYDLAPSQNYYDEKGSYFRTIKQKFLARDEVKDLSHTETINWLVDNRGMNSMAYANAANLHTQIFDNFDLRDEGVDVYNIAGCKSGTIGKIIEKDKGTDLFGNPVIEYLKPQETPGDGTVPLESATNLPVDNDKRFFVLNADHSKMLSQNGARQQIVNIIAGTVLDTGSTITGDVNACKLNGKAMAIYSPLSLEIFDQFDNRLGFAEDGSLQNDIPGADFKVFSEHKFVYLPDEGAPYGINFNGTGEGSFTLGIDDIDGNSVVQTQNFINIPVSPQTLATLEFANNQAQLLLDNDGNGSTDEILSPHSVLDENMSQDLIAPVSISIIAGLMGKPGFYRSDVHINFLAEDPVISGLETQTSGVYELLFSLDGGAFEEYVNTIIITDEGEHELKFYSIDNAGNRELGQAVSFAIDKTPPEFKTSFSLDSNDFVFEATDNQNDGIQPDCDNSECSATDRAGNISRVTFQKRKLLTLRSLSLEKAEQNGSAINFPDNLLLVNNINLRGQVKDFNQTVLVKKQEVGRINYIKKKDISNITSLLKGQGLNRYSLPGLHYLEVLTKAGELETKIN